MKREYDNVGAKNGHACVNGQVTGEAAKFDGLNLLRDVALNLDLHDSNQKSPSVGENTSRVFPKLVIQLTNEEIEEDFMALTGSKLPERPHKRTFNLSYPSPWMCDLTLERYEVAEKQGRGGLKAMRDVESHSD